MRGLWSRRQNEHRSDESVRRVTASTLIKHRQSLKRVEQALATADETLAEEIRRLDAVLEGRAS